MSDLTKPLKILCVDDETAIFDGLSELLSKMGLAPVCVGSVEAAIEVLKREGDRFVLILSDYSMPGSNGFDFRRTMLGDEVLKQIPFVLMSGQVSRDDALKAVELKIAAFLDKPFTGAQLKEVVARESADRAQSIREDDEMLAGFVLEATGMIEEMESLLLSLREGAPDVDAINRIFACAHTIKGTSGFFKPDTIHRFTHRYEDYFSQFKKQPETLSPGAISVLLAGLDSIKALVAELASGQASPRTLDEWLTVLQPATDFAPAQTPTRSKEAGDVPAAAPPATAQASGDLRISVAVLDQFMERSGELTVLRNMVNKTMKMIEADTPGNPNVATLADLLGELHKANAYIQDQVTDMRKVSLSQIYKPLSRTMRDLCVGLRKDIQFELKNGDLRIDHTLADILSKCLVHMIRNSADHGIESGDDRTLAGKPAQGHLTISANETSEEIVVNIVDDGRGIDARKISAKAIEKGLISKAEADAMSESEIQNLIFAPGFSTAEKVTDVSGRGVGTDMVRNSVLSCGGRIDLKSKLGQGTEFILRLPIPKSVLIISSLLIRCEGRVYAIPEAQVLRVVRIGPENEASLIDRADGATFYLGEDGLVPILKTAEILGLSREASAGRPAILAYVKGKGAAYCLEVDEVLDIEDTVVKKPGNWLKEMSAFCGATFLADGRIGLILDIDGIAREAGLSQRPPARATSEAKELKKLGDSILSFDIGGRSAYGVLQKAIFRLEEFSRSDLGSVGEASCVVYRDRAMRLIDLEQAVLGTSANRPESATIPTLVVQRGDHFVGLVVHSVGDFITADPDSPNSDYESGKGGVARIFGDQIVTLLDLDAILSDIPGARVSSS